MAKNKSGAPFPPSRPASPDAASSSSPSSESVPAAPKSSAPPVFEPGHHAAETPRLRAAIKSETLRRPMPSALQDTPKVKETRGGSAPFWTGVTLTLVWFAAVGAVALDPAGTVLGFPITNVALGLSGALAPPALLWMVIAYLQRATDIRAIIDPLRRQLQMVLGTGAAAENRVRRFNDALEKQLELLRTAGDGSYEVLQGALQVLQEEEQAIHALTERSSKEVSRVAGIVRDNSEVLEDLLHDNRERFNELSSRIADQIATLDEKSNDATNRLTDVVDRLHGLVGEFLITADKKLASYGGIAGEISSQEKASMEAAERMAEMLSGARAGATELNRILSSNHDLLEDASKSLISRMREINDNTAMMVASSDDQEEKFAERSQKLSQTLAREIAALDTLTGRLETQISATTEGLGQRADMLEEKQIRLVDQAAQLMQGLEVSVQSMEQSATTAYGKFAGASEAVQAQSARAAQQFLLSGDRYEEIATKLDAISYNVAERVAAIGVNLDQQTASIARNASIAAEASYAAQSGVGGTLEKLELMIERIFDAENKAKASVGEMSRAYSASLDQLQNRLERFGTDAQGHLGALSVVQDEFDEAGSRLAERARQTEATWQSLVGAAARQQELLQSQLREKIEEATGLLNENAAAIEGARDSLYANIESAFAKAEHIKDELKQMGAAVEAPFDEAVGRVQNAVQQGQYQIAQFIESLGKNARQLTELNDQLAEREEKAGHKAAETLAGLDAVAARIEAIQVENMQATQDVLLRLTSLTQQLQSRMGDLSSTAETEQKKLAEVARQLSMEINGLIHDSQTADQRVRMAAALLSDQAGEVRGNLEAQAEIIGNRLDDLKGRFAGVAEQMQEIGRINDTGIDGKVDHLSQVVREASARLEGLGTHIDERAKQLSSLQGQLGESGKQLDSTTQVALDRLSVFTHAMVSAQTTSADTAQQIFGRLNEMQEQFRHQIAAVSEGSQTITGSMRGAVAGLVEQSVALAAASEQAETRINGLAEITQGLEDRAVAARSAIESQVNVMQSRLSEVLGEIESASVGLERNAMIAFDRSEGMSKRFSDLSTAAFTTLGETSEQIGKMAEATISKVEDVNQALAAQVERVTFAGVHLAEVEAEVRSSAEKHAERINQLAAEAGSKAMYAADQLRQQVAGLREEADAMLSRFGTLGEGFAGQSSIITGAAAELESSLQRMQETSSTLGQEGRATAEKISGHTVQFRQEVEEALQNMAGAGDALEKRGDFALSMLHQMAGRFAEATQNLGGQFEAEAKHLQDVSDSARSKLEDFGQRLIHHTDRLDAMASTLTGSSQQIGEALEKANFLLRNLSTQTDRVKGGVQEIGGAMLQRLSEMLCTFEDELKNLTTGAGLGLEELERRTETIAIQMKARSQEIGAQLKLETDEAVAGTATQLAGLHNEFRSALSGATDVLINHLRQVQESGAGVMEVMQAGTTAGAQQALQVLAQLRVSAEQEVQTMAASVGQSLGQLEHFGVRIHEMLGAGSFQAGDAAQQIFARFRQQAEQELQGLLGRTAESLQQMQGVCDQLTRGMHQAISQAEGAGQNFVRVADQMREAGATAAASAAEAGQGLTSAQLVLQRSQSTLLDVAQKSGDALHLFNDNLMQQARQIGAFQSNLSQVTQTVDQADQRLVTVQAGFEKVIGDLVGRLNEGLYSLSKQVLAVRGEAEGVADIMNQSAEGFGQQNAAMVQTAGTLAKALSQLEGVSRTLSESLTQNTIEVEARTQTLEEQAARLRRAGETANMTVDALGTKLQNQFGQMERVSEAARNSAPIQPVRAPIVPPRPSQPVPPPAPTRTTLPPQQDEAVKEMMNRLQAINETRAAAPLPQAAPAPRPAPPRTDNELVASLTQIIQQLEETAGGKVDDPLRVKTGK